MNIDHTKKYTLNGVFIDTKDQEVLAGRYAQLKKQKQGGMGARLVGAAAGAAVGGPVGAAIGFLLLGNKKK